jgi:DNA/RNA-binding domain of Phe-tRNA-synthetase-like protein
MDPRVAAVTSAAIIEAHGLTVTPDAPDVWRAIDALSEALRLCWAGVEPSRIDALRPARDLYKRIGEDPTKTRPSSEALLRRVLRGLSLYRVNSLVDLCNLCSLDFLLPIGLYDLDRLRGDVRLRFGAAGESYESLGKGTFAVEGRLVVADDEGACGSPTNDSRRTSITLDARSCLMIVFAPAAYDPSRLARHARCAGDRVSRWTGGRVSPTSLLPDRASD